VTELQAGQKLLKDNLAEMSKAIQRIDENLVSVCTVTRDARCIR
jgi:hypothetical protein